MKYSLASGFAFAWFVMNGAKFGMAAPCTTTLKKFYLWDAETNKREGQIKQDSQICVENHKINIEAFYGSCSNNSNNPIQKVKIELCKKQGRCVSLTDTTANYMLYGDGGGQANPGNYAVFAKAYNGTAWTNREHVDFTFKKCNRNLRANIPE
jgi:hypothetical protein